MVTSERCKFLQHKLQTLVSSITSDNEACFADWTKADIFCKNAYAKQDTVSDLGSSV